MIIRSAPLLIGLLLIGGCQKSKPDALPADAQGEAQTRTSAKAAADIAAAENASQTALPASDRENTAVTPVERARVQASSETSEARDPDVGDMSANETTSR